MRHACHPTGRGHAAPGPSRARRKPLDRLVSFIIRMLREAEVELANGQSSDVLARVVRACGQASHLRATSQPAYPRWLARSAVSSVKPEVAG